MCEAKTYNVNWKQIRCLYNKIYNKRIFLKYCGNVSKYKNIVEILYINKEIIAIYIRDCLTFKSKYG